MATLTTFVCHYFGVYGEGEFDYRKAYPYLCFLQNGSVMYALYCLVLLYHATYEELQSPTDWRPLGKFLCVKAVVFFCWWQGVLIFVLSEHGWIQPLNGLTKEQVANGLIDYCVVVEMVFFSIAHAYTFTYKDYLPSRVATNAVQDITEGAPLSARRPYVPPETLDEPLGFRDAFWSSSVPRDTLSEIRQLRVTTRTTRDRKSVV